MWCEANYYYQRKPFVVFFIKWRYGLCDEGEGRGEIEKCVYKICETIATNVIYMINNNIFRGSTLHTYHISSFVQTVNIFCGWRRKGKQINFKVIWMCLIEWMCMSLNFSVSLFTHSRNSHISQSMYHHYKCVGFSTTINFLNNMSMVFKSFHSFCSLSFSFSQILPGCVCVCANTFIFVCIYFPFVCLVMVAVAWCDFSSVSSSSCSYSLLVFP